jgi:CBS domain-containing protein
MRKTSEVVTPGPWAGSGSSDTMTWLARLLREEGQDLMDVTEAELKRGTPVYVQADSDVVEVQRRMARHHIRVLPVLAAGGLIGVVDLVELAQRDDLDSGGDLIP